MLRPTRNVLDLLKDWQAAGEPYVKVVAPLAWPRATTPAVAIAPLLHARTRDDVPSDLGLASKPIYLTISTETLPVTVDALSSSSSSGIISPTSLSSKTAAVRGGPVNSVDDDDDDDDHDDDDDDDDAMMMMISSSNSGPSIDHQQLKTELYILREQLRRANNRYDVLL